MGFLRNFERTTLEKRERSVWPSVNTLIKKSCHVPLSLPAGMILVRGDNIFTLGPVYFHTYVNTHDLAVLRLWIIFVICVLCLSAILSCLFLAPLWSPAGKCLTSWLSCLWCFLVFLTLSHVVCIVRCGIALYRFLIFAFFLTLMYLKFDV